MRVKISGVGLLPSVRLAKFGLTNPAPPILWISWIISSYGDDFHFCTLELHGFGHNIAMKLGGGICISSLINVWHAILYYSNAHYTNQSKAYYPVLKSVYYLAYIPSQCKAHNKPLSFNIQFPPPSFIAIL